MATSLTNELSLSSVENLFKIKYGKRSENLYNSFNYLLGTVKKSYDFTGRKMEYPAPFGFQGGVSSGTLPEPNAATYNMVSVFAKKVYAICRLDREAIKASMSDEGAFVRMTKEAVSKTVESWMRNMSRILFGNGYGAAAGASPAWGDLGAIAGTPTESPAGTFACIISAASWKEANFEENDFVNVGTGTELFEVTNVAPATRTVTLVRQAGGVQVPANLDIIYMQRSRSQEPAGLKGVCDATTGQLYGINVQRRWQATQIAAGGAGITPDIMNQLATDVERRTGKPIKMFVTSYKQHERIINQLEDLKRYPLPARSFKGQLSFQGVEFMTSGGPVPLFADRFCEEDRIYGLNPDFIHIHHRPGFGWFTDDIGGGEGGAGFLRVAGEDSYEARYGGYLEVVIAPTFQGVVTGLAV